MGGGWLPTPLPNPTQLGPPPPSRPPPPPPPRAGDFLLEPGFTQLSALRNFELHGNIASLGDVWRHPGLTRLVLLDSNEGIPGPQQGGASLPALREACIGHSSLAMPPLEPRLFRQALCGVTSLVSLLRRVIAASKRSRRRLLWRKPGGRPAGCPAVTWAPLISLAVPHV